MPEKCTFEGCELKVAARGLCSTHYWKARTSGDLELLPTRKRKKAACAHCGRRDYLRRKMCSTCYNRDRRNRVATGDAPRCSVPSCERVILGHGLCSMHYSRMARTGSTDAKRAPPGTGCVSNGYRIIGGKPEHRILVSKMLGRRLDRTESVHHRNGDRADNRLGPCLIASECRCPNGPHNLELWSKTQPAGKRVSDLIAYANEVLRRYPTSE